MAGLLTLDLKGFSEVMANLEKMDDNLKKEVSATLERGAQLFVRNAKRDAPVDHSTLKQGIDYFPKANGSLSFTVTSNVKYSAYLEWGTIKRVSVPEELASYAIQFKGRGIRKNGGIFPHPFFFKQQGVVKQNIEQGIEALLKDLKL